MNPYGCWIYAKKKKRALMYFGRHKPGEFLSNWLRLTSSYALVNYLISCFTCFKIRESSFLEPSFKHPQDNSVMSEFVINARCLSLLVTADNWRREKRKRKSKSEGRCNAYRK